MEEIVTIVTERKAYLLTSEVDTPRKQFSIQILNNVGFKVIPVHYIKNKDNVLSNKLSMMYIYETIAESSDPYAYVFEDDINVLEPISLADIVKYEKISPMSFYLGCCIPDYQNNSNLKIHDIKIDNKEVTTLSGAVRGLHAIGLSNDGAKLLCNFAKISNERYMDMILEDFTRVYPANVIRYDLESYIKGHRGVFFQDRDRFPSTIP